MFQLLFLIISYGAFLLLLMPPTGYGILSVAVLFVLGACLIVVKKLHKAISRKNKQYHPIAESVLFFLCFGSIFYTRWYPSSKVQAISTLLHMSVKMFLLLVSCVLVALSIYLVYIGFQILVTKFTEFHRRNAFAADIVTCLITSVIITALAQVMIELHVFSMGYLNFLMGVLIISVVILFLYCLFGKMKLSIYIGAGIFMVFSTINAYVYKFRGRTFEPIDIFSAGTALNVLDNYRLLPIPLWVFIGWAFFFLTLLLIYRTQHKKKSDITVRNRCILLTVCVISSIVVSLHIPNLAVSRWEKSGAAGNGCILDFVLKFKDVFVSEPEQYSTDLIETLSDQYPANSRTQDGEPTDLPHIIVIMDESFSDLSVAGDYSTNKEVMSFISSLKENTISGYALASVYGGNTANSEYEFLTGNSMAWLSPNSVPYQQYIRSSSYSMVSYLKSTLGYKAIAMHPYNASGWNRPLVYNYFGFDNAYFLKDFPQINYLRNYVSDRGMFDFLIETYEAEKENKLFLFGVTMQNHGGYKYTGESYTKHISLTDYDGQFPDVEQYLSLIHETDQAVEHLISYFERVDEDILIVFFGDHQPKIDTLFYDTIGNITENTMDEHQKRYQVPFFIWANYDIEEDHVDCTSLNYLSSYVYEAAGIALPPYNQFLKEIESYIPSVNAHGFYSLDKGRYLTFDEANDEERYWLDLYEALQYNSIFDKKHLNEDLFPVLE